MDTSLKTFLTILAVSMLTIGTLTPALAVSPKAYSFEDNLEVTMPNVAYQQPYVPGEIVVKFNPGVSEAKIKAMNSKNGASVTYTSPYAGFKKMKIPKTKSVEEMVEIYSKNPNVEYATANYIMHAAMEPNDSLYPLQWNFHSSYGINVEPAWYISTGEGVIVAVLDTGVNYNALDLESTNFIEGWDFISNDDEPQDDHGHGTHVIGTIAQSTDNNVGVAGVAFDCTIMPVKVLDSEGSGSLDALLDGIAYATDNGADVISMSLGFSPGYEPPELDNAITDAYNQGVTVIAAAGNDNTGVVSYPAASTNCIAVGATEYTGRRAYYSNYGDALDIMAPGGDIRRDRNRDGRPDGILQSTFNGDELGYFWYQGTSMATPHVSGVAALVISNSKVNGETLTPSEVRTAIESTAMDLGVAGWDSTYGHGLIDAYAALNYFGEPPAPNENQLPTAKMIITPTSANIGETISFDASGSTDPDSDTLTYSWDFDGIVGEDSSAVTTTYIYTAAGNYDVVLTVTDDDGATDTATETVIITDNSNPQTFGGNIGVVVTTGEKRAGKNLFAYGIATIAVTDNVGSNIDATISGQWSGAASDIDTTPTTGGTATVSSDNVKYTGTDLTFTFTVDSITVGGVTYEVSVYDEGNYPN